ncbi:MAG: hypothetical protein Q7T71_08750, partial [Herbiconiux sp.]|nr:hypothetical protein [Herbiconiux sp.]
MAGTTSDDAIAQQLDELLHRTVRRLQESGARTEALARYEERRPLLGIRRGPVMRPLGRVWRLGVLLLDTDAGLHTIGLVTRALEPGRVTNQSARAEERRDHRRAAFQAKFAEGDTVNFDTAPVATDAAGLRAATESGAGVLQLFTPASPETASAPTPGDADDPSATPPVLVRWNRLPGDGGLTPLAPYLAERAE